MVGEKIKFHLDESVSNAIADGLRRRKIDDTIELARNWYIDNNKSYLK